MSHKNFKDLSGKSFGCWKVLKRGPNSLGKHGRVRFYCKCQCGTLSLVLATNLTRNLSNGCIKCSSKRKESYHGKSDSKTYSCYIQMIERCHTENHKYYSYYGGRGIEVSKRWREGFKNFLEDMGEKPDNLSLDRIDNDKGYSKSNCRWSTRKEQQNNRRNSINIGEKFNGWTVLKGLPNKMYIITCNNCLFERPVRSCNFRRLGKHKCNGGN